MYSCGIIKDGLKRVTHLISAKMIDSGLLKLAVHWLFKRELKSIFGIVIHKEITIIIFINRIGKDLASIIVMNQVLFGNIWHISCNNSV